MNETERTNKLLAEILIKLAEINDNLKHLPAAPAAGPHPAINTLVVDVSSLKVTQVDDQINYHLLGPLYPKFGIRVYPEVLPLLNIDPSQYPASAKPYPFSARVTVLLNDSGNPKKAIGLAPDQPQPKPQTQPKPQPTQPDNHIPF